MTYHEEQEYQEMMGSPEMEYLQYLSEHPESHKSSVIAKTDWQHQFYGKNSTNPSESDR